MARSIASRSAKPGDSPPTSRTSSAAVTRTGWKARTCWRTADSVAASSPAGVTLSSVSSMATRRLSPGPGPTLPCGAVLFRAQAQHLARLGGLDRGPVEVLHRAPHRLRVNQGDGAAVGEHADVVADVAERLVQGAGDLTRADRLLGGRHLAQDLPAQGVAGGPTHVLGGRTAEVL